MPLERHDAALLADLVVNGPQSRAILAPRIWPQSSNPRANLRKRLQMMRERAGLQVVVGDEVVSIAQDVQHDLTLLRNPAVSADSIPEGELLGGLDYSSDGTLQGWVNLLRERWRSAKGKHFESEIARMQAEGRHAAAEECATRWVALMPQAEHAHHALCLLYYRNGNLPAARQALNRCTASMAQSGRTLSAQMRAFSELVAQPAAPTDTGVASLLPPSSLRDPPVTIGQDAIRKRLLDGQARGMHQCVLGEAGIGKTRLARDLHRAIPGSVLIQLRDSDRIEPFGGLRRILQGMFGSRPVAVPESTAAELSRIAPECWPQQGGTGTQPAQVAALAMAFRAWYAGGVAALIVDGAQALDRGAADLLTEALALAGEGGPPCILLTRAAPAVRWPSITLAPLDLPATESFLSSLQLEGLTPAAAGAWARAGWRFTAGNPLYTLEWLAAVWRERGPDVFGRREPPALADSTLPGVDRLLDLRLSTLSEHALTLARTAALAQGHWTAELLAAAAGQENPVALAAPWAELERHQIFSGGGESFAHDLYADRLRASTPVALARAMHLRLAQGAERLGLPHEFVAHHWHEAEAFAQAGAAYRAAADRALAGGQRLQEIVLLQQAIRSFEEEGDAAAAFDLQLRAAGAALLLQPVERAMAAADELSSRARSPEQRLDAALFRYEVLATRHDTVGALEETERALNLAQQIRHQAPDSLLTLRELRAHLRRSTALSFAGRSPEALAVVNALATEMVKVDEPRWHLEYQQALGTAHANNGANADAERCFVEADRLAGELSDTASTMVVNTWLLQILSRRGKQPAAHVAAQKCLQARASMSPEASLPTAIIDLAIALVEYRLGRYRSALGRFGSSIEPLRQAGALDYVAHGLENLARCQLHLGQIESAQETLRAAPDGLVFGRLARALLELEIALACGEPIGQRVADLEPMTTGAMPVERLAWQLMSARVASPEAGIPLAAAVLESCAGRGLEGLELVGRIVQAQHLVQLSRPSEALEIFAPVRIGFPEFRPYGAYPGEIFVMEADLHIVAGHQAAAAQALQRGWRWLHDEALPNVPAELRQDFLQRNRFNRRLVAAGRSESRPGGV